MQEINRLEGTEPDFPYEEILYLRHPISRKHPRLAMENRAAQFAPFAALSGFGDQIKEVQRLTDCRKNLDENYLEELDDIILTLQNTEESPFVKVTYFQKDLKKNGGSYFEKEGFFCSIDSYHKCFIFQDKVKIPLTNIVKIEIIDFNKVDSLI